MIAQVEMHVGGMSQVAWVKCTTRPRQGQEVRKDGVVWLITEVYDLKEEDEVHASRDSAAALPSVFDRCF